MTAGSSSGIRQATWNATARSTESVSVPSAPKMHYSRTSAICGNRLEALDTCIGLYTETILALTALLLPVIAWKPTFQPRRVMAQPLAQVSGLVIRLRYPANAARQQGIG